MLKELQKQPLSIRKKILIIAVSSVAILIVFLWIFSFHQTLRRTSVKTKTKVNRKTNLAEPNFAEIKDEFKSALKEFSAILNQMQSADQLEDQASTNLTLPENN